MVPHVFIHAEPLHTSEPGSSGHHLQHRLDRRPQRVPRDSELSSQARDRGMFTAKLLDRPPTRTHGQTCPRSHDYRVLLREHLLHTRTARRNTRFACATHTIRTIRSKHGASTKVTSLRPWPSAITPRSGQPIGDLVDSTPTVSSPTAASTSTVVTCKSPRPTSRSQRTQYVAWVPPQRAATQHRPGQHRGPPERCVWSPPILRASTRFTPTPTPTPTLKSH